MNIKTKYEIGQHIWVVYKDRGVVSIYDDFIGWIAYEDYLYYGLKETCNDVNEEDIILYEELDNLVEKVKQLMQEIREKEASKDESI